MSKFIILNLLSYLALLNSQVQAITQVYPPLFDARQYGWVRGPDNLCQPCYKDSQEAFLKNVRTKFLASKMKIKIVGIGREGKVPFAYLPAEKKQKLICYSFWYAWA